MMSRGLPGSRWLAVGVALWVLYQDPAWAQPDEDEPAPEPMADAVPAARPVYERDVVEVDPAQPITLVSVDNRLGDVRVEGHDSKSVVISAVKRARDSDTLERLKVSLLPDPNGPVRISTSLATGTEARPIASGSIQLDLVIRAPRTARVEAQVWNGKLAVIGMENGAELRANEGDIDVANVSGTVETRLAAGKQRFVEVFGAVDAQAVSGDMNLDVVRGRRLDARVHEGRILSRKLRVREVWLRATKGDIRFHGQVMAGGRYVIGTYRGDIEIELDRGVPLRLWARSGQGKVVLPPGLEARADARGGMTVTLPGARPGHEVAPAVFEVRSRMGNIQFAVVQ